MRKRLEQTRTAHPCPCRFPLPARTGFRAHRLQPGAAEKEQERLKIWLSSGDLKLTIGNLCCFVHSGSDSASKPYLLKGPTVQTTKDYIDRMAKEIQDSLTHFLLNHSEIEARKPYDEIWCMGPEGDRYYEDMDAIGRKMQTYLKELYDQFFEILQGYMGYHTDEMFEKVKKSNVVLTRTIEHKLTFCESNKQALKVALEAFDVQLEALKGIPEDVLETR